MSIAAYCRRDVFTVEPRATLREAAEGMARAAVGCAIVVEERRPLAVLTDRDLALRVLCDGLDAGAVTVGELGLARAVTLGAEQPLVELARCLRRHRFRRVPVVGAAGELVGIIAADDLLPVIAAELSGLAAALARRPASAAR